jgi:uncharacterized protein (TIGR04255 family)
MSSDPTRIVGYNIYQTTNPDIPKKEWEKLNDEPLPNTHFAQDKRKLKPGVTYYSFVTAVNALGIEGEPSEIASVTIPLDQQQEQSKQTVNVKPGLLPKRITPTPVKEAITEIRFNSSFPADSIFGIVYNAFKETYSNVEKLPILQVPEVIRANDPAFVFQPYYRLRRGNFLLSIGPKVLSLVVTAPYPGWSVYLPEIVTVFTRINELGLIENVTRGAIRYIDFFSQEDIFKNINLTILMNDEVAPTDEAYFRTLLQRRDFQSLLQIANNSRMEQPGHPPQIGSIIDVDSFRTTGLENFFDEIENYLNAAHYAQKELFFSLLKPDFLARFNPEYDEE